jgi:hypothetical protein
MTVPMFFPGRVVRTLFVLCIAGLAACTTSTAGASPTVSTPTEALSSAAVVPSARPSSDATPGLSSEPASTSPEGSAAGTAVPTAIDPCKLVPADEVSKVVGFTVLPGDSSTGTNNVRICSYGQEGLDFNVLVAVAPDAATAKGQEPAFKADLEQAASEAGLDSLKLTELPGFEPGVDAAIMTGSVGSQAVKGISLYALKGAVLLAMSDIATLGSSIPTSAAMEDEAHVALGRLP